VRRARVAFNSLPPNDFIQKGNFSPHEVSNAVEFLEIRLKAQQNDSLVLRWLESAEWPADVADFEKTHGLDIDPNYDIFIVGGARAETLLQQLKDRNFARLIKSDDIVRDDDHDQIDDLKFRVAMRELPAIESVRPNRVHYIREDISDAVRDQQLTTIKNRVSLYYVSRNTNVLLAPVWTPNVLRNLPKFAAIGKNLLDLKGAGEGATAVIIGAGPSLDTLLPDIAAVKEHVVILCAFKALKAVVAAGINPDFVVCLDPKQKVRHMEGVDLARVGAFIIEAASNSELVASISGCPLIPYVASPIPLEVIRSFGKVDIPIMTTGGSAVHGALQTAILLGCKDIYFAGTDFGRIIGSTPTARAQGISSPSLRTASRTTDSRLIPINAAVSSSRSARIPEISLVQASKWFNFGSGPKNGSESASKKTSDLAYLTCARTAR
jgi:hypothetical protein